MVFVFMINKIMEVIMFSINDTIIYGTHGICRITDIINEPFKGAKGKYYILTPAQNPSSTIYVPVDNDKLTSKMSKILSKEDIYALIKNMPDEEDWIENKNERADHFRAILASGERIKILSLIKTIYKHREELKAIGKRLHIADETAYKNAEKIIYDEFALVLDIRKDQVIPFIIEQMTT